MEPKADIKRAVLEQKLRQFQVQGYEHSVNAVIARELGDEAQAKTAERVSVQAYQAARKTKALLDALPEPSENGAEP